MGKHAAGRPAAVLQPHAGAATPVFVDDSGRRHRLVRLTGWVVGGLVVAYLSLLAISLVGSPGLVPLTLPSLGRVLPGPAAPAVPAVPRPKPAASRAPGSAAAVGAPIMATPAGAGSVSTAPPSTRARSVTRPAVATPRPSAVASASAAPRPTAAPTPVASATPSAAHSPRGNPTPHPSKSNHPTPHSTHAAAGGTAQ